MNKNFVLIILCTVVVENKFLSRTPVTKEQALKLIEILTESLTKHSNDPNTNPVKDRRTADDDIIADDYEEELNAIENDKETDTEKPCVITVIANYHDREMPTLIRRYRYNANGILIPHSVKYFMKLSVDGNGSPILVPFSQKSFSPTGGYISYYKQVPPIPHSV